LKKTLEDGKSPWSYVRKITIVVIDYCKSPTVIYRFNAIIIRISTAFFTGLEKYTKIEIKTKSLQVTNVILSEKSNSRGISKPAQNNKNCIVLASKQSNAEQWDRIEDPYIN
jgi:hypothetical protein